MTTEDSITSGISLTSKSLWLGMLIGLLIGVMSGFFLGNKILSGQIDEGKLKEILSTINNEIISPLTKQNEVSKEMNIAGNWVYTANSDKKFLEGFCNERSGTTHITKGVSIEYNIQGLRKERNGCEEKARKKVVTWQSDFAPMILTRNKILVWFHTNDDPQSLGLMILDINFDSNSQPTTLSGPMFYLEDNKTWIRAEITFYKDGSEDATQIKSTWH